MMLEPCRIPGGKHRCDICIYIYIYIHSIRCRHGQVVDSIDHPMIETRMRLLCREYDRRDCCCCCYCFFFPPFLFFLKKKNNNHHCRLQSTRTPRRNPSTWTPISTRAEASSLALASALTPMHSSTAQRQSYCPRACLSAKLMSRDCLHQAPKKWYLK